MGFESWYGDDARFDLGNCIGMDSRYLPTSAAQALYPELKCFLIASVVKWPFMP